MNDYYVYVYIDPRNYEEFYYGKGKGTRKDAHLGDSNDSKKSGRIQEIVEAGLKPIIRVIASRLSESDALLIEKTLLWKLGRQLTNVSTGHYAENFRPHDKMHLELPGFDFENKIYYYNVGDGTHRKWEDYKQFGFISGGQGVNWKNAMLRFRPGDVVIAYLKNCGFVGVGKITQSAKPIRDVHIQGQLLLKLPLIAEKMSDNMGDDDNCEYVCTVEWLRSATRNEARWLKKSGLYTTTHVRASLEGQQSTLDYIESAFDIRLLEHIR